jgi:alpha-tubulin suppressor-like RCC1 family protein
MAGVFCSQQSGRLKDVFITEFDIVDRFVGDELWGWGCGVSGQLGDNSALISRSSPVQTVSGGTNWKQVSGAGGHTAAIKTDGTLWLWGFNIFGFIGDNSRINRSSPVQTVSGGTNWYQVSAGISHIAAIKTDGTLWMWGCNSGGRLSTNNIIDRSSPVQTVSGGTNWKQVSVGETHTAAIKTDGTLWLWGDGSTGRLGTNNQISRSSPVQTVSGGTNWKQVELALNHSAAIKTDGTLWMWGCNGDGKLGRNNRINRSSPVQTVSGGTNWKQVSAGSNETAAIKTDGTLWVWGCNGSGELGNNSIISRSSPVQTVSGGTNWKQVSAGGCYTGAIKTDGTLWLWGSGSFGDLGDNSRINRSSPVQTVSGGTNWKQVDVSQVSAAVKFNSSI